MSIICMPESFQRVSKFSKYLPYDRAMKITQNCLLPCNMEYEHFIVIYRMILNYLFIFMSISNVIEFIVSREKNACSFC